MVTNDPEKAPAPQPTRSPRAEALLGGAPDEQIADAVRSERWARAADLIALHGERILLDGGVRPLATALEALPDDFVSKDARVAVTLAWVRIYEQRYQDARQAVSQAERALQQTELAELAASRREEETSDEVELTPHAELKQSLGALRLHLQAVSDGRLPGDVSEIMLPASADHPMWRAGALVILGRCRLHAGDLKGAKDDLETAHILAGSSRGQRAARIAAESSVLLGRVAEARGALAEAERRYAEVIEGTAEASAGARVSALVGRARVALLRLELEVAREAMALVDAALAATVPGALDAVHVALEAELARAKLHALEGRYDEARAALDGAERGLAARMLRWPMGGIGSQRARLALLRRDESTARRWLQGIGMQGPRVVPPPNPIEASVRVTEALVRAALHDPAASVEAANAALAFAEQAGHRVLACEALVALALGSFGGDKRDEARAALLAACEIADREGVHAPLAVRGLASAAAELGVQSAGLGRAAACLPAPAAPSKERPAPTKSVGGGLPIQTNQVLAEVVPVVEVAVEEPEQAAVEGEADLEPAAPAEAGPAGA